MQFKGKRGKKFGESQREIGTEETSTDFSLLQSYLKFDSLITVQTARTHCTIRSPPKT